MSGDSYLEPEWDDDLPPVPDLDGLARFAETQAAPAAPAAVRRAGTARRRRRHVGTVAGALALLVAAGGIAVGGTRSLTDPPPPVASPTPAARTVTAANVLEASDIVEKTDPRTLRTTPDDIRRDTDRVSACLPDGWIQTLGATASLERRYGYQDDSTAQGDPVWFAPQYEVVALQFPDGETAGAAETQLGRWLDACPDRLGELGYTQANPDLVTEWYPVTVDGDQVGRFAIVPPYRTTGSEGWFDSVGLTRVDDRLMVTDRLKGGNDDIVSVDPSDDSAPPTAQFSMITAASQRLRA